MSSQNPSKLRSYITSPVLMSVCTVLALVFALFTSKELTAKFILFVLPIIFIIFIFIQSENENSPPIKYMHSIISRLNKWVIFLIIILTSLSVLWSINVLVPASTPQQLIIGKWELISYRCSMYKTLEFTQGGSLYSTIDPFNEEPSDWDLKYRIDQDRLDIIHVAGKNSGIFSVDDDTLIIDLSGRNNITPEMGARSCTYHHTNK